VIPLPELASELAIGLGAALFGANALVLFRTYSAKSGGTAPARPPSTTKVVLNMVAGAVVALVGLASFLGSR
jgi:hypothetical protein